MATMIVPADRPSYVPVGGNELMLLGEFSRTVTIECACGPHSESFKLIADDVLTDDECDRMLDEHLREHGWLVDDSGEWCPECYANGHHRGDS